MSIAPSPLSLKPVVLASSSPTRADMLRHAGVDFEVVSPELDEPAMIAALTSEHGPLPPPDIALVLAEAKAQEVARAHGDALVIGADQTLELDGRLLTKATTIEEARRTLLDLAGRTHALHSAVALVEAGETVWRHVETAWLTARSYSPRFVGRYLALVGADTLGSVGGYRLEGPGAQLFARVEGDWFTVLGLPLLPVLAELRRRGALLE